MFILVYWKIVTILLFLFHEIKLTFVTQRAMLKNGTLWYIVFLESFQFLGWPICFVGTTSFSQMHVSRMHHSRYHSFPNVVLPNYFLLSAIIFTKIPQADDPGHTLREWRPRHFPEHRFPEYSRYCGKSGNRHLGKRRRPALWLKCYVKSFRHI